MDYYQKYKKYRQRYKHHLKGAGIWGAKSTTSLCQTFHHNLIRPHWDPYTHEPSHFGTHAELRPADRKEDVHLHQLYTRSRADGSPTEDGEFDGYVLTKQINNTRISGHRTLAEIKFYFRCIGQQEDGSDRGISIYLKYTCPDRPEVQRVTLLTDLDWNRTAGGILGQVEAQPGAAAGRRFDPHTIVLRRDWVELITARLRPRYFNEDDIQVVLGYVGTAWRAVLDFFRDYQEQTDISPMCQCGNSPHRYPDGGLISQTGRDGYRESDSPLRPNNCQEQTTRARWKPHVWLGADGANPYSETIGRETMSLRGRQPDQATALRNQGAAEEVNSRAAGLLEYQPQRAVRNRLINAASNHTSIFDDQFQQLVRSSEHNEIYETNRSGGTPLHIVALAGNYNRVDALLQLPNIGTVINQPNNKGYTPLDQAIRGHNIDIIKLIYRMGGRVGRETEPDFLATLASSGFIADKTNTSSWASDSEDEDEDED